MKKKMLMTFMTSMTKQTKHIVSIPPTTHTVFSHYSLFKNQPKKERIPRDGQRESNQLPPCNNWEFYLQLIPSSCTRISTIGRMPNSQIRTSNKNAKLAMCTVHTLRVAWVCICIYINYIYNLNYIEL
jgi:hypothetical protein